MTQRPFAQIDVFTATPYLGNPVAVVLDADGITDHEMAAVNLVRHEFHGDWNYTIHPTDAALNKS